MNLSDGTRVQFIAAIEARIGDARLRETKKIGADAVVAAFDLVWEIGYRLGERKEVPTHRAELRAEIERGRRR